MVNTIKFKIIINNKFNRLIRQAKEGKRIIANKLIIYDLIKEIYIYIYYL